VDPKKIYLHALVVFLAIFPLLGCGLGDSLKNLINQVLPNATTKAAMSIDEAINALQNQSANWQQVLQDLESKLAKEGQNTIRDEVANVLSRSIAQSGVEIRCEGDFVRDRIRQALIVMKAKLLGQTIPAPPPAFCQVVPIAVDRAAVPDHVKQLEIYGYDFDLTQNLTVAVVNLNGARQDVTGRLDRPTHYAMTLKFGGSGVQLTDQSERFEISLDNKLVSTVAIIQPATPVCESKPVPISPGKITYVPPKVGSGDSDFYANGPRIAARISLAPTPQTLIAHVFMDARETKSDFTEAVGAQDFPLYSPPPGWAIDHVVGRLVSEVEYTDSTTGQDDRFSRPAGEPVQNFLFVGDTDGPEAGTRTKMDATFNQITVVITENTNCVSDRALKRLRLLTEVNPATLTRLQPKADAELKRRDTLIRSLPLHP
jgi:hypothetical protein